MTITDATADINAVLDALHDAAARAQFERYFGLYTPDAVFLGTDATERWTLDEFKAYARPHFESGKGWTYTLAERHVSISPAGDAAWFDESLDNAKLGRCRGSGALILTHAGWKITQYNLTLPIPNDLILDVATQTREYTAPAPPAR